MERFFKYWLEVILFPIIEFRISKLFKEWDQLSQAIAAL
jgi:hypothetical protein